MADSPRYAAGLHVVCQRDVVGPDIKLPLPETEHAAVDAACVDADPHVHINPGHLTHQSVENAGEQ